MKYAIAPVLLLAALALGQSWVVEQVDSTAASESPVELVKAADGKLWIAYETDNGAIRIACLGDSGWYKADVCSGSVPATTFRRPFLAAGPHGELCLSCTSSDSAWLYRLAQDTWEREPYPFLDGTISGTVAYDTTGRLYTSYALYGGEFWVGHETDSGWTSGYVVRLPTYGWFWVDIGLLNVVADDSPWFFGYGYWYDGSKAGDGIALMHLDGDTWARVWGSDGGGNGPIPVGLAQHGDGVGFLTSHNGSILCDSESIASVSGIPVASLAYSNEDVPLVVWVPLYSPAVPAFASKTNRWHLESIPGPAGIGGIDIETDSSGQVVVVYSTQDSGLWCARGTNVVGTKESPKPQALGRKLEPTILSRASGIRRLASSVIFDAMGRRVASPRSGVYFVRDAGRTSKVVIQR